MTGVVAKRLAQLGITIPKSVAPASPWKRAGNLVFIRGQIPKTEDNSLLKGTLGSTYSLEEGKAAARVCAINLVSQMREACVGDLDKVKQVLKIEAFVSSTPEFTEHPQVVNG